MDNVNSSNSVSRMETQRDQSGVIQPLLTDLYQITMAYAYWKSEKRVENAVFDLFFRKNPFKGEFTIFAGLGEVLKFLDSFHYSEGDVDYLRSILPPTTEPEFFDYLLKMDASDVQLYAIDEGTVVFPKEPLMKIMGPLPVVQLLETTLLTLINYASLVATNAARFRLAAGPDKSLLEFGLRRAQGPDGGLSASKYCYMGGFDGTSNVLAGKLFGIPVKGTHAHAFITSFTDLQSLPCRTFKKKNGEEVDFVEKSLEWLDKVAPLIGVISNECNKGELAAFIAYAIAFPDGFLCLLDTYDVIRSGVPNFLAVCMTLNDLGYQATGVRLDSGDLAYLSVCTRKAFRKVSEHYKIPFIAKLTIVASNDINEDTIHSLNQQGHEIDSFGIGTHLVTCQRQPALGCVFKLVQVGKIARIKLSEEMEKVTLPGQKNLYRLYGADGNALVDLLSQPDEVPPVAGDRVLCRHPFQESKRAYVIPAKVQALHRLHWHGKIMEPIPTISDLKDITIKSLQHIRPDHKRALNPTPYKVAVTDKLYKFMHELWLENAPIGELS